MSHPVTGSGAAQSSRPISAFEARAPRRLLVLVPAATPRTRDLPLTRRLLFLLSYAGMDLIAVVLRRERGAPLEALSLHACRRPDSAHSGRPCASRDACSAVVPKHTRNEMWSGYRASNPGPRPWRGRALPAELYPLCANAHRTQLCRRVRGNLLKSSPMRQCASVRSGGTRWPVCRPAEKSKKARILSESGPRRVIE